MRVVLVGVNHQTAPVDIREKLNLAVAVLDRRLIEVIGPDHLSETAVLSTCNRLEIYFVPAGSAHGTEESIVGWLAEAAGLALSDLSPLAYRKSGREAVGHLLRVACGLDSQILGETQVLGQVSECFVTARTEATVGPLLTFVLSRALHAGKRARTETGIAHGGTSVSHAAASLVARELGTLSGKRVVIIGVGETAGMALEALRKRGDPQVACVSRSITQAQSFAAAAGCEALPWSALGQALATADAVISATSAPHPILYLEDVVPVLEQRSGRPLVMVDVAVPRDIDSSIGELASVALYDIDLLEASLDEGRAHREAAIPTVEEIVSEETGVIMDWIRGRQVAPLIRELRRRARAIADAEARRTLSKLGDLDAEQQEVVFRSARRMANKLLHEPTVRLKELAQKGDEEIPLEVFKEMFGLDSEVKP